MTSKYDLLITIDQSTGINPGVGDRAYCPGQTIKGTVDLNVYEKLNIEQIQVSLLGFEETTFVQGTGRDPRTWKEKHIFLKHFRPILPMKPNRATYKFEQDDNKHSAYEFLIPEYSNCETCRRVEKLPPSMEEAQAVSSGKVMATASIIYQIEVVVESKAIGNIFFHEKFTVHPLAAIGDNRYNDIKRNYVSGEKVFKSKIPDGGNATSSHTSGQKKSSFRSMFSSSGGSLSKSYNLPLKIGIRPEESFVKIIPGRNVNIPSTSFLFEYMNDILTDPPLVSSRNNTSTRLGQFIIRSLKISARYPYIKIFCAGNDFSVQSKKMIYVNNTLNVPFDIGNEFKYNSSTNTFQKEMLLLEDITGHMIDIPLDSYQAEFPLHCNHIARMKGALEFAIGLVTAADSDAKPEYITVTVPFDFRGVEEEFQAPSEPLPNFSDLNIQAPPGPPPGDYKAPPGPPPGDSKAPLGPPTTNDDHKAPVGPPPNHSEYSAPSGPPPTSSTDDKSATGSDPSDFASPAGPPPSAPLRNQTDTLIDLDSTGEALPTYTEMKK
ncbi:hypothetical protein CLIB1423_06S05182 [[Candida] railenensis]|uniref:Uncharacterized protein n=1 Tax=[Candida] railenensis TaxID=45579 RepID=A0A9P0QPK2_9ASCO|nr:hypothetical protein CLIB1423_06S05182 [[Candida] railenensis]